MAIKYILKPKKDPQRGTIKTYAQIAPIDYVDIDEVTKYLVDISSLSEGEVASMLVLLQKYVIDVLASGRSVRLGDLGSFRPTISSRGVEAGEDFDPESLIKKVNVRFTQSGKMLQMLDKRNVKFRLVEPNAAALDEEEEAEKATTRKKSATTPK